MSNENEVFTLRDAHRAFAALQGRSVDDEQRVEVAVVPATGRARRLDLGVLRAAAQRLGYGSEADAVRAACEITRSGSMARAAAAVILDGQPPGAIARAAIAAFFGVDEHELWAAK